MNRRLEQIYLDKIDGKVSKEFWREQSEKWQREQEQVRQALAGHEKASAAYFEEGVMEGRSKNLENSPVTFLLVMSQDFSGLGHLKVA